MPGFDTPVSGEGEDDDATDIRTGSSVVDSSPRQEESARRSRFYDDEEGRA